MSELRAIETLLVGLITAACPTLNSRVYAYAAPDDAEYPFVLISNLSANDVKVGGAQSIAVNSLYQVKVVDESSSVSTADNLYQQVHTAIERQRGASGQGYVLSVSRVSLISYATIERGVAYRHRGGEYRILAQEAQED